MEPVRVAAIGVGAWADTLASKSEPAGLDIVSCYARSPDGRAAFAERHEARAAESLDALLDDPQVEGVLISTPHSTHADLVAAAASAGKHVFVEKPFTMTVASARRAIAACADAGVVLQVSHKRRRQPALRRMKQLITDGELGVVHLAEANLSNPKALRPGYGWRGDARENPAGGMGPLGVHMADSLIYLLGRAARLAAFSKRVIGVGSTDTDEVTAATLEFETGAVGFLATSTVIPDIAMTAVHGTEAAAYSELDGERFSVQRVGERERTVEPLEPLDIVADMLAEFARCVRGDQPRPENGGEEGLEVVAVWEAMVESAASRQVVELDEIRARGGGTG